MDFPDSTMLMGVKISHRTGCLGLKPVFCSSKYFSPLASRTSEEVAFDNYHEAMLRYAH